MEYNKNNIQKKNLYCVNCDKNGHSLKNCDEPITSYGIALLDIKINDHIKSSLIKNLNDNTNKINIMEINENNVGSYGISIEGPNDMEVFCGVKNQIKFMLIRRKHTLGFIEFIRGRYNIDNIDGIIFLFKQMTPKEINQIKDYSFDELWNEVWGNNKNTMQYQNEYILSKEKFTKLKSDDNGFLSLNFYIDNVNPNWIDPEWGFPKGRRNFKESNKSCAIREFIEETGFEQDEIAVLNGIEPIEEKFIGTNGINYKHIYYVAISQTDKLPIIDINNIVQINEIGDIGYFSFEESIKKIRPYHVDRQKIVTYLYIFIINNIIKNINIDYDNNNKKNN